MYTYNILRSRTEIVVERSDGEIRRGLKHQIVEIGYDGDTYLAKLGDLSNEEVAGYFFGLPVRRNS